MIHIQRDMMVHVYGGKNDRKQKRNQYKKQRRKTKRVFMHFKIGSWAAQKVFH